MIRNSSLTPDMGADMATGCCGHGKRFRDKCRDCGRGYPKIAKARADRQSRMIGAVLVLALLAGVIQLMAR